MQKAVQYFKSNPPTTMKELTDCVLKFTNRAEPAPKEKLVMTEDLDADRDVGSDEEGDAAEEVESDSEDDEPENGVTSGSAEASDTGILPNPDCTVELEAAPSADDVDHPPDLVPPPGAKPPKLDPWDPSRNIRVYKGSKRPAWAWPELWASMSQKERRKATAEEEEKKLQEARAIVSTICDKHKATIFETALEQIPYSAKTHSPLVPSLSASPKQRT